MADHIDNMREILDNGDVPQRVTNKMILSAIQQLWALMGKNSECLSDIADRLSIVEDRVDNLEDDMQKNPSMIAYVKDKPVRAVGLLISFLFLLTVAMSFSEPLRAWVSALIP